MTAKTSSQRTPRRRRRARRAPDSDVLSALAAEQEAARQLAGDLVALLDAGLIEPIPAAGELRFAVADRSVQSDAASTSP